MAKQPDKAWKRAELYEQVWGEEWFGEQKLCDVHISQIRNKIKKCGSDFEYIKTVWKIGYKFQYPAEIYALKE